MYRGRFGIIAGIRRALAALRTPLPTATEALQVASATAPNWQDLRGAYERHAAGLLDALPQKDAMEAAIGGGFDETGQIEVEILQHYGLKPTDYLIDVGCGSGRLAKPLSRDHVGPYLGIDVVESFLAYARDLVGRADWRFEQVNHIEIPEADGAADCVCFFSVFTHLLHEQSYWYLQEAQRVLKPGGLVVFSTLEFGEPAHWRTFIETVNLSRAQADAPLNVFLGREIIPIWAAALGLEVVDLQPADALITPRGHLGQAVCVLRKAG